SGHVTATSSMLRFFEFNNIFFYIWIFITILVMFSRVYLGMHYLSDVVAGLILGYGISDFSMFIVDKIKLKNQ
ncbi:MAG: phosphatase PAP2 family protein, partial [Candidatus Pacearchaeota archaeon]|nr:phosphatase PAP2 family protein [Candidatus Pacearchaeota archaeon]